MPADPTGPGTRPLACTYAGSEVLPLGGSPIILVLVPRLRNRLKTPRGVIRALRAVRARVLVATPRQLSLVYDGRGRVRLYHAGSGYIEPAVIFHWLREQGARDILDILEQAGFRLVNRVSAWRIGNNKALQLAVFERHGIPHPWSLFTYGPSRQLRPLRLAGQRRFVIKPHNSGRGVGVVRAWGREGAVRAHRRRVARRQGSLIQAYIETAGTPRRHYRVDVIGGRAVTGGIAYARGHPWITNEARGGYFQFSPDLRGIPETARRLAERAAAAVGADFTGVDIIEDQSGKFYVLEANEGPMFEARTSRYLARHLLRIAREAKRGREGGARNASRLTLG